MTDWWGNQTGADTSREDEARFQTMRKMLLGIVEICTAEEADADSVMNGGTGTDAGYRGLDAVTFGTYLARKKW